VLPAVGLGNAFLLNNTEIKHAFQSSLAAI